MIRARIANTANMKMESVLEKEDMLGVGTSTLHVAVDSR